MENFEKQVKDKMDEIKIQPSETVWDKVLAGISEKKRRRWPVIFLMFLFIAGAGIILWNAALKPVHNDLKNSNTNNSSTILHNDNKLNTKKTGTIISQTATNNKTPHKNFHKEIDYTTNKKSKLIAKETFTKLNNANNKTGITIKENDIAKENNEVVICNENKQSSSDQINNINNEIVNSTSLKPSTGKAFSNTDKQTVPLKKDSATDIIAATQKKIHAKNKWRFGVVVVPGVSSINDASSFNYSNYSGSLNSPGAANPGPGQYSTQVTAKAYPAFAIVAGIFAQKNISKKIQFVAGINFKNYSIQNSFPDSLRFTGIKNHEHFNYIEIPLSLQWHFNKSGKLPLYIAPGISFSKLVNTSLPANSSLNNKVQFTINGALLAGLFHTTKSELLAGLYYSYGLSDIAGNSQYPKQHFSFLGLRFQFLF